VIRLILRHQNESEQTYPKMFFDAGSKNRIGKTKPKVLFDAKKEANEPAQK
jgi:hypothetical protein